MVELKKPEVIFTHESDLDGMVSGVLLQRLALHLFQETVPLQAFHTPNWKQRPLTEKTAWVSDFTMENRMDRLNWLVVDHHQTTVQPSKATFIHDASQSAGSLCYELCKQHGLQSPELDRLVELNNLSDIFIETHPDFELSLEYASLVKTYSFWNLLDLIQGQIESLLDHPLLEVIRVKNKVENPLGLSWSKDHILPICPSVGLVRVVVGNVNMILHALLKDPAVPFDVLVTLIRKNNGLVLASFRSRGGQALAIAQRFQGGGHPNASGATLPRSVQSIPDAISFMSQTLATPTLTTPQHGLLDLEQALTDLSPE